MDIERCPSGIPGLDELLGGGIPRGSSVLVTGTPGSAKTIFSLQFLVNGVIKYGERGIFISIEESIEQLHRQFMQFGYDIMKLQDEGKLLIIQPEVRVEEGEDLLKNVTSDEFIKRIKEFDAKRLVIDPLNLVLQFGATYGGHRREVERLIHTYKKLGYTSIFTHERTRSGLEIEYSTEDFVVDGIIYLQLVRKGGIFDEKRTFFGRRLTILKMRETKHEEGIYQFRIEEDGIHVYP